MSRNRNTKPILYRDDEEIELPTHKEVCPGCRGNGKHVNRNIDGNGITASEMEELGDDFREDYMNGVYDVPCETCGGANVVDALDEDRCDPVLLGLYHDQQAEAAREWESERWLRYAESGG